MIRGDGNEGERKAEYEVLRRVVKMLKRIADRKDENLMGSLNLVICLAPCLIGGIVGGGGTGEGASGIKEEIEVCRVSGGTAGDGSGGGGNTVGGVLKIMIERYEAFFSFSFSSSSRVCWRLTNAAYYPIAGTKRSSPTPLSL